MAASSLLALIDDVASILDDVSILAKVAAKKTTGVLGDDLALNAQQVGGVRADRELPVVWAVAKGSARNKLVLVPLALLISRFLPWLVTPLLMVGGAYLCYEGFEKVAHRWIHSKEEDRTRRTELARVHADLSVDLVAHEKEKIKGAVRTDFVLSAEIVAITLGTVAHAPFSRQAIVLCVIAALMTLGVYGLVALIVKLDDLGLFLVRAGSQGRNRKTLRLLGGGILTSASMFMKLLAVAGTVAMFLVGGGILRHGLPFLHPLEETLAHGAGAIPLLGWSFAPLLDGILGMTAGGLLVGGRLVLQQWARRRTGAGRS